MSTYTDLHNRIKENLTILRKPGSKDDGMSPQKVILINPENQFYGTFNGKMNVTGGILSGLKIVDSELEDVKLDGATIGGISLSELKDTIDVNTQDIEQLQKDAKYISASHNELSTGLSSAIDGLSVKLNEKLDNTIEDVKKSISGAVGDVAILSDGLGELSSKVEALSSGTLNGVVYRGQLVLYHDIYTLPRQLFNDDPACCLLEGTQASLKNGWMWRIALDRQNISGDYVHVSDPNTGKELDLGEGDYIIIKNHLTSLYEVVPDNKMRLDDFDVINSQDEDDTKLAVLKQISAYLDNRIDESLVSAKAYTDEVSTSVSILFDRKLSSVSAYALDESIKYTNNVSSELSNTVDVRLVSLSNDLSSYSNKLCSDLSIQVDAEYVHRAGDAIVKLSVIGDLDVGGKTTINHDFGEASGTKLEISQDKVELKTFAPLSISSTSDSTIAGRDIALNAHNLSINLEDGIDDLFIGDRTIKEVLSDTYLISDDISYRYDKSENALKLGVRGHELSIDVAELFDKKIIKYVQVIKKGESGTWIAITFDVDGDPSTSEDEKTIEIRIDDFFKLYTSGYGISVDNELRINISKEFDDQVQAIQGYVNELSGPVGPYIGIIPSLSAAIDKIDLAQTQELFFGGLIELDTSDTSKRYPTIGAFLSTEIGGIDVPSQVRNNTYFDIKFFHGLQISSVIITEDGLSVGDGDQLIIHEHNPIEGEEVKFISWADLKLIDENAAGNVYLIKAGVSRYEFEAEVKNRKDDDNYISAWISANFGNTVDVDVSPTTIFNQNLSATKDLSVQNDAFILNNLYVSSRISTDSLNARETEIAEDLSSKNVFVSNKLKVDSELDVLSGSLWCHKAENGSPQINVNGEYISIEATNEIACEQDPDLTPQNSIVEVDPSYISISSNQIDLSANQILVDFRNLKNFQNLSSAAQIHDALSISIDSKIFIDGISAESLCAIHISQDDYYQRVKDGQISSNVLYVVSSNYINAYGQQLKNLAAPTELSDATTKEYVDSISSSLNAQIQKLSDDLSSEISSLEDNVLSNDAYLSTAIDNKIFIDGISAESLCAVHIGQQEYYNLVSSNLVSSNVLYVVSSENINAYGQRIENLAEPELSADATTKGYVDGISSSLSSQIQQLSDDLSSEIETLSTNLSTSISSLTSQMELALSALGQDTLSSLNRESKISTVIEAVLDIRDTLSLLRTILRI